MYADHTLTPREAIRLCALGTLVTEPMPYDDLVLSVRRFVSRIVGPSLDLMGESIELLRYEGLVAAVAEDDPDGRIAITNTGRQVLHELLTAHIRVGSSDVNSLVLALKFRFFHLLQPAERREQIILLREACETELARVEDLRNGFGSGSAYFTDWLGREVKRLEERLAWLDELA